MAIANAALLTAKNVKLDKPEEFDENLDKNVPEELDKNSPEE